MSGKLIVDKSKEDMKAEVDSDREGHAGMFFHPVWPQQQKCI